MILSRHEDGTSKFIGREFGSLTRARQNEILQSLHTYALFLCLVTYIRHALKPPLAYPYLNASHAMSMTANIPNPKENK
jgi:hypothetical protein